MTSIITRTPIRGGGDEWSSKASGGVLPKGTTHARRGCLHHLRTTLAIVLLSMLVVVGATSAYLQLRHLEEDIRDDTLKEEEMNQPSVLNPPSLSRGREEPEHEDPTIIHGTSIPVETTPEEENDKTATTIQPTQQQQQQQEQQPILVYTNMYGFDRQEPCDVPCIYTTHTDRRLEADASVYERRGYASPEPGDRFSIYLQMEGEHYYPISLDGYHLENSYRWVSPLLKPYFEWIHFQGAFNISNPPVSFNNTINGASFIARNCASLNSREDVVIGLRKAGFQVDGLSSCLQTKIPTQSDDKLAMMQEYKFNLAFENGNVQDYVTEKVYQALAAGVVPIYMGAPNIREYVPDNSIINVADYDFNTTLLAQHLQNVMNNQTLYESYHAWRFQPLPDWFVQKFNFTWVTTECRTCRYIHAHKNGWTWDKENQRGIPPTRRL